MTVARPCHLPRLQKKQEPCDFPSHAVTSRTIQEDALGFGSGSPG